MSAPDISVLPAIPRDEEGPVFRAPWEAQAFAMAVMLHERGHFAWTEWAARLAESLAAQRVLLVVTYRPGYTPPFGDHTFHTRLALTTLSAADKRIVVADELHTRRDAWEEAARNTPHGQPIVLPGR